MENERDRERKMKSYSILRLQCNPSLNGFPQITACSSIKSVSHCKLPTVSVSQLGYIYMSVCVCVCAYLWAWSFYDWRSVRFKPFRQISAETSSAGRDWLRTEHTHLSLRTHTCKNPHRRKLVLAGCVLIELSDTCLHGSQPTNTYHTLSTHTSEAKKFEKK